MSTLVTATLLLLVAFCTSRAYKAAARKDNWALHLWCAGLGTFIGAIAVITPLIREPYSWFGYLPNPTIVQMRVSFMLALIAFVLHDLLNVHKRWVTVVLGVLLGLSIPAITQIDTCIRGGILWAVKLVTQCIEMLF